MARQMEENATPKRHDQQRRLVILIGPPKTGSTSLQAFLSKYASKHGNGKYQHPAFVDWNYPLFLGSPNGIGELERGYQSSAYSKIRDKVLRQPQGLNLVVGSEYLIHYHRILDDKLFDELSNWTQVPYPEVVIQSRSPRTSHLMSIWKQQTQVKIKPWYRFSFQEYFCSDEAQRVVERRLGGFANPMGIAYDLITNYGINTTLMDMGGMAKQNLDMCHAFACSVLRVNCTNDGRWVQGLQGVTMRKNPRHGDALLREEQLQALETLFHQRDCSYYHDLHSHSLFHLLYRHSEHLWPNDCQGANSTHHLYRKNVTVLLEAVRQVLECPGYSPSVKAQSQFLNSRPQMNEMGNNTLSGPFAAPTTLEEPVLPSESTKSALGEKVANSAVAMSLPRYLISLEALALTIVAMWAAIFSFRLYLSRQRKGAPVVSAPSDAI